MPYGGKNVMSFNVSSIEVLNVGLHVYFINILHVIFLTLLYLPTP